MLMPLAQPWLILIILFKKCINFVFKHFNIFSICPFCILFYSVIKFKDFAFNFFKQKSSIFFRFVSKICVQNVFIYTPHPNSDFVGIRIFFFESFCYNKLSWLQNFYIATWTFLFVISLVVITYFRYRQTHQHTHNSHFLYI